MNLLKSVFLFPVIFLLTGCMPKKQQPANLLTVGVGTAYAPFVSINARGELEGFDIDLIHAIGAKIGRTMRIQDLGSMPSLFAALNQGKVDALIWGLSITQERLQKVAMIKYLGQEETSYPLLFRQAIPEHVRSINDMQGMTICVEPGSAQEELLRTYPFIKLLFVDRVDDALLNVQYGKADAALLEPAIAEKFRKRYPEMQTLPIAVPRELQLGTGIALAKDNTALATEIEQAVAALKAEGFIDACATKWGLPC